MSCADSSNAEAQRRLDYALAKKQDEKLKKLKNKMKEAKRKVEAERKLARAKKREKEEEEKAFNHRINEIAKPYGFKIHEGSGTFMSDFSVRLPYSIFSTRTFLAWLLPRPRSGYGRIDPVDKIVLIYEDMDNNYPNRKIRDEEPEDWVMLIAYAKELEKQLSFNLAIQKNYDYNGTRRTFNDSENGGA